MSRSAKVSNAVLLAVTLEGRPTTKGVRARVYNSAGTEQVGSPFTLTHRANGHYSGSGWTPTVEGEYSVDVEVYLTGTFTTPDPVLDGGFAETVEVNSVDADTATLLSRLTAGRATNLDNLDAAITTRASQATLDTVDAIVDAILVDTDTTIPGLIAALNDLAQADIQSAMTTQGYTPARGANLDDLDATISSRESEASASGRASTNQTEHDATQAAISALNDPDAATIADAVWDEAIGAHVGGGSTGEALNNAGGITVSDIADAVWDEAIAGHTGAGTAGEAQNLLDDIESDSSSLNDTKITTGRANAIDNLDATVSSRATQTSVDAIQNNTNFVGIVPGFMKKPTTGTKTYRLYARLFDDAGNPENPDGSMSIRIEQTDGTVLQATIAMTSDGTGQWHFDYVVGSGDTEQPLHVFFEYDENSVSFSQIRITEVTEFETKLDGIQTDLTAVKAQTDQFGFTSGNVDANAQVVSDKTGYTLTSLEKDEIVDRVWDEASGSHTIAGSFGEAISDLMAGQDPDAIADKVWDEVRAGHTTVGTFGEVLDAKVSSRESSASAAAHATVAAKESTVVAGFAAGAKDATVAKEGTLSTKASQLSVDSANTKLDGIKSKTDAIVMDGDKVRSRAAEVADKTGYTTTAADKAALVDLVWDETLAGHSTAGTTGKALTDTLAGATPAAIADAVWDEAAADHVSGTTMGGKLNDVKGKADANSVDLSTLKTRLSDARADKLDNLDAPVSATQTTADAGTKQSALLAEHATTQAKADAIIAAQASDPKLNDILNILQDAVFGLHILRIQLDAKATLAGQSTTLSDLSSIKTSLADAATGLAALKTAIVANNTELVDGSHGLAKLRTELDGKATLGQVSGLPDGANIANAVWDEITAEARTAGSYGQLLKDRIDAAITTRGSAAALAVVDGIVDDIKAAVENGTHGLAALKTEIDANETKIDDLDSDVANVDADLVAARADILAAVGALVDGTPTIIAALDVLKGAGFSATTDSLEAIRNAIGTGSATLGNQSTIISKLDSIHGVAPDAGDTIVNTVTKLEQTIAEVLANRTQIGDKVDDVDAKVDTVDAVADTVLARLDDGGFGLAKAKTDRDAQHATDTAAHAVTQGKVDTVDGKVVAHDSKLDSVEAGILAAISGQGASTQTTKLDGIISLLNSGTFGLLALKDAITLSRSTHSGENSTIIGDIGSLDTKMDVLEALLLAIRGAGFGAGDSLESISAAVADIDVDLTSLATAAQATTILDALNTLKGAGFDVSTDTLEKISERGQSLEGFQAGEG